MSEPDRKVHRARWFLLSAAILVIGLLFAWDPTGESAPTAREQRAVPVRAVRAELGTLVERTSYPGELVSDAAELAANVTGRLSSVRVRLGDRVRAGEELARIDATDWRHQREEALAEVRASHATERRVSAELAAAQRERARVDDLLEDKLVSAQQADVLATRVSSLSAELEQAKAQRAQAKARVAILDQKIADCRLVAPFDGVVSNRYVDPGTFLMTGTQILRLVADGPLRVRFEVPEASAGLLTVSATITARISSDRSESAGRIVGVGGEVDRSRRIIRAEAVVEEAPESWLPGMFVEVLLAHRPHDEGVLVPDLALLSRIGEDRSEELGVFKSEEGIARWVPVRVLARAERKVAIEAAVAAGDLVLVSGHSEISDGARIRVLDEPKEQR